MQKHVKYRETERARYAVKHIKEDYYVNHDSDSYIQAARYVILFFILERNFSILSTLTFSW